MLNDQLLTMADLLTGQAQTQTQAQAQALYGSGWCGIGIQNVGHRVLNLDWKDRMQIDVNNYLKDWDK